MSHAGWTPLDDGEYVAVWSRFQATFRFRLSMDSPAIDEPAPSLTLDLGPTIAPHGVAGRAAGVDAINAEVLRALIWVLPDHDRLVALDVNHACYWFDPVEHAMQAGNSWPITPFPDGDYHGFFTADLADGVFGHPWEPTLTIIGQRLVATLGETLRTWLPLRRLDGRPV